MASSNVRPVEIDTTSSQQYVYFNTDIKEVIEIDEETGVETTVFNYIQKKVTRNEYNDMIEKQATENSSLLEQELVRINEVLSAENVALKEELISTQLALVEIYENSIGG